MQSNSSIVRTIVIVVATILATILFYEYLPVTYSNTIAINDIIGLLFNATLVYYIGATFVRSNDKNKSIREFYLREAIGLIETTKRSFDEIKGVENNFANSDTTLIIQSMRDQIEYLLILNENLLNNNRHTKELLNGISTKYADLDLSVNSGRGTDSPLMLDMLRAEFSLSVTNINTDFAKVLKTIS